MNIIITGFCGTGSSAIEDLILEYDNCTVGNYSRFEHVLFYIPDGLFDLEDRIIYNNSFHMFDGAIKRFRQAMVRLNDNDFHWFGGYQRRTHGRFMEIVDDFIESLIQYKIDGYWSDDIISKRTIRGTIKDCFISHGKINKYIGLRNTLEKSNDSKIVFSFINREKFLDCAKVFVRNYLNIIRSDCEEDHFIFDQLILPQHISRIANYFDDTNTKVILVDRDPRDLYVLSKYIWPYQTGKNNKYFPDNVEEYIMFHSEMRKNVDFNNSLLLKVQFENLIYDYESSLKQIELFLGVDSASHKNKGQIFRISESIKNTQNFTIKKEWLLEVEPIKEQLREYIYNYPYQIDVSIEETTDP